MASYSEIANQIEEIRAQRLTDTLLYSAVRTWLENPRNGPWIMVVDGLDSERTADILKKEVLPRENKGQLLFTGRNPQCIEAACGHNVECLEIQKPHPDDCLKIFRSHLVDGYYDEAAQGTSQLLENLWLPLVIKMAAIHMNKFRIPHQKMCDQVNRTPFMFDQIRELDPNSSDPRKSFVNVFLGPLLEDSAPLPPASNGTKWGQELRLLCFLACLNKDKVTNRLIKANYKVEKHATVDTNLYKLVSYGFIEDIGKDTFRMHKFVQDSVIAYIRAKTGEDGLFLRFGVALGALVRRYDEKIKEERSEQAEWLYRSASSYAWKIPFMPHFARFVEMTSEAKSRGLSDKFIFQDRAVESIVTFSRVYMEQGRSEHAIEVLEFAQNHHRGNQAKVWLNQTLAQAYKARASTAKYSERRKYIDKAEVLFKALIKEADEVKLRFLKWDLVLELTRLYWESNECTKAWKQLESMQMFRFTLEEGRVVMVNDTVLMKELPKWNENDKKSRLLVIRVQYEEGLVHLETGNAHAAKGKLKLAIQSWTSAKEEFSKSTQALHTWLPDEKELLLQIEESIADADRAIGTPDLLEDAESKLKEHITLLRDNFKASDKRLWETECRLARVLSKGGHDKLEEAIELLVHLYESHSKHLGKESGETLKTASLLRDVYILAGQESKARELEITSGLEIEPRLEHSMRARTSNTLIGSNQLTIIAVVAWVTIAVPVCISTGILLLRKGKR